MKNPWEQWGRQQDDMEALQTDVMRFMAILGLCLAAIFSLVKSPDFLPTPTEPAPASVEPDTRASEPVAAAPLTHTQLAPPAPAKVVDTAPPLPPQPEPPEGFALEFESADSLRALLQGGNASLYLTDGSRYWRWRGGRFVSHAAPELYYRMQGETVPTEFKRALPATAAALVWGIVLPDRTLQRVESLMRSHQGGDLVISAAGDVDLR